jgi:hypothetical protein
MRSKTLMSLLACAVLAAPAFAVGATATTSQKAHTARYHKHLVRRDHTLAKHKAYLHHQRLKHDRVAIISRWTDIKLVHDIHKLRRQTLGYANIPWVRAKLRRIAMCESPARGQPVGRLPRQVPDLVPHLGRRGRSGRPRGRSELGAGPPRRHHHAPVGHRPVARLRLPVDR